MYYNKCIQFHEFGHPQEVLRIGCREMTPLQDEEALVRMLVRPMNPSDILPVKGSYAHRIALPNIPGYEGVGIVEKLGVSVPSQLLGKRVLALRGEGTWQEYVKTSAKYLVPVADTIDDFTAAQMYINPMTAWVLCNDIIKIQENDILLVNAGGSAIVRIFAQLATILNFTLIAVTRNNRYTEDLLKSGASFVIDTSRTPIRETVLALTKGKGADIAIDCVGGSDGNELAFSVKPGGLFFAIGLLSGEQVNWQKIVEQKHLQAKIFHLRHWNQSVSIEKWQEAFQQLTQLIIEDKLQLMQRAARYDLLDIKKAMNAFEQQTNGNQGKIFLTSY